MSVHEYKCPSCGAPLIFGSETQNMTCEYCGSEFDVQTVIDYNESQVRAAESAARAEAQNRDAWQTSAPQYWEEGDTSNVAVTYSCSSCGGEIIGDVNTAATHCPYCNSPAIMPGKLSGDSKPDYILPFTISKAEAEAALKKDSAGKRLLPTGFLSASKIESITGMYIPFWLYDCDVDAEYNFRGTQVTSWRSGDYRYTRTDHFLLERAGQVAYDGVPVNASSKSQPEYLEAVEPYQYSELRNFAMPYLSGFFADKYDIDAESCQTRANERIKNSTNRIFAETCQGYGAIQTDSESVFISEGRSHYVFLPVWMLNTVYNGKNYMFAVNGQTGKVVGEYPTSKGKAFLYWLGTFLTGTAAIWALMHFLL